MPTTRPRVPGWHPDPDDPASLRHWDGRRWGAERRPRPSWAPPPPTPPGGAAGPARGSGPEGAPPGRRRWWFVAGAALLVGLAVLSVPAWLDTGPEIPPRSVADTAFTAKAEAACARALPELRRGRPESREDTGTDNAFARRIDDAADGLEKVAAELRTIPVAPTGDDGAEVDGWLDAWDAYVAVGRGYADRVRAGEGQAAEETRAEAAPLERQIYLFAKSNGMPSCVL